MHSQCMYDSLAFYNSDSADVSSLIGKLYNLPFKSLLIRIFYVCKFLLLGAKFMEVQLSYVAEMLTIYSFCYIIIDIMNFLPFLFTGGSWSAGDNAAQQQNGLFVFGIHIYYPG